MKFISNIKYNIQHYLLSKNSRKSTNLKAVNFENASKIAIIYKVSENNDDKIKKLAKIIRSAQKDLTMLGFTKKIQNNYLPATNKNSFVITNNDLNFFNLPNSKKVTDFLKKEYDILLDVSDNKTYPISYISSKCKATLKVGFYSPDHTIIFDLMLDSGNTYDIDNFIKQLDQYIHLIDKK